MSFSCGQYYAFMVGTNYNIDEELVEYDSKKDMYSIRVKCDTGYNSWIHFRKEWKDIMTEEELKEYDKKYLNTNNSDIKLIIHEYKEDE